MCIQKGFKILMYCQCYDPYLPPTGVNGCVCVGGWGGEGRCILGARLSTADLQLTDHILTRRVPMNRMGAVV